MARKPLRPLIRSGGFYPSRKWTPLVYAGGYTTANGGGEPEPPPIEKTVTGNPIHILDALAKPAQALSVKLEPIQDLHGYDNPWPAGGGTNKLWNKGTSGSNNGITWTMNADGSITLSGTASATTYIYFNTTTPKQFLSSGPVTLICSATASYNPNINGLNFQNDIYVDGTYDGTIQNSNPKRNFTGDVVEVGASRLAIAVDTVIPTGTVFYPAIEIGNTISATWTPYSNICPISGHTDADVTRTGKNLFLVTATSKTSADVTMTVNADGTIALSGTANALFNEQLGSIYLEAGTQYYISGCPSGGGSSTYELRGRDASYNVLVQDHGSGNPFTPTTSGTYYVALVVRSGTNVTGKVFKPMIRLSSVADSTYSPYVGTTYPIPLGQTVYGGTLDVLTGVLTVDMAMVDLGSFNWNTGNRNNEDTGRVFYVTGLPVGSTNSLCSIYKQGTQSWEDMHANNYYLSATGTFMVCADYANKTDFATAVTGQTLCYELATPQTYQLTPTEVTLLLGENNLFSDGEMTLVYLADGNASDEEALNILLGGRYVNNHTADEPSDREALNIILGGTR